MKPKLEALRIAEVKLQDAQKELEAAESKLQDCQDVLTKLQSKFEAQMAKKRAIEDNAARTRSRMEQVCMRFPNSCCTQSELEEVSKVGYRRRKHLKRGRCSIRLGRLLFIPSVHQSTEAVVPVFSWRLSRNFIPQRYFCALRRRAHATRDVIAFPGHEHNANSWLRRSFLGFRKATALIVGLGGERTRWTEDSRKFADTKRRLVGDVALSCAFVGYCGPFNQEFRDHLVKTRFSDDLVTRGIPLTKGLGLTSFLVDMGTIGDWNLDGLPTDPLSIQNGILVSPSGICGQIRPLAFDQCADLNGSEESERNILRYHLKKQERQSVTGQVLV